MQRQRHGQRSDEGDQIAGGHRGDAGLRAALPALPAQARQHQGEGHAAGEGQQIAARRVGRRRTAVSLPAKNSARPAPTASM